MFSFSLINFLMSFIVGLEVSALSVKGLPEDPNLTKICMVEATGETGARTAAVGVGAAVMVWAAAVVETAAVEGATVVEEAVGARVGARVAVLVGGGAALDVAAAAEAAAVNEAVE